MKIAILGTATSSLHLAPFDDPEWEIWVLAHQADRLQRADRAFELHSEAVWKQSRPDYADLMRGLQIPLYMQAESDAIPNALAFPRDEIMEKFKRPYFTSSSAWMVAFAIMQKPDAIGLWGIDMLSDGEYADQRPCVEFLLGLAMGRGIQVAIPTSSALLKADHEYGYETKPAREAGAITRAFLEAEIAKFGKRIEELDKHMVAAITAKEQAQAYLDYVGHYERTGVRPAS